MQPYPALDADCLRTIAEVIRGQSYDRDLQIFTKCIYTAIGAGLNLLVGEPDDPDELKLCEALSLQDLVAAKMAIRGVIVDGLPPMAVVMPDLRALIDLAGRSLTALIDRKNLGS